MFVAEILYASNIFTQNSNRIPHMFKNNKYLNKSTSFFPIMSYLISEKIKIPQCIPVRIRGQPIISIYILIFLLWIWHKNTFIQISWQNIYYVKKNRKGTTQERHTESVTEQNVSIKESLRQKGQNTSQKLVLEMSQSWKRIHRGINIKRYISRNNSTERSICNAYLNTDPGSIPYMQ